MHVRQSQAMDRQDFMQTAMVAGEGGQQHVGRWLNALG
jgi:hypothetical protein